MHEIHSRYLYAAEKSGDNFRHVVEKNNTNCRLVGKKQCDQQMDVLTLVMTILLTSHGHKGVPRMPELEGEMLEGEVDELTSAPTQMPSFSGSCKF